MAVIRLTGEFQLAPWLILLATGSGLVLAMGAGARLDGRSPLLHYRDAPLLVGVALALALSVATSGVVVAATFFAGALWKTAWEELWFRGLWVEGAGRTALAAAIGSLAFCAMHLPQTPERAIVLLVLSGLYYALRAAGASVIALVLLHSAINAVSSAGLNVIVVVACLGGLALFMFARPAETTTAKWKLA